MPTLCCVYVGVTQVIITGGVDLSSGSIVGLTAIFTGMVLALQLGTYMERFGAKMFVSRIVGVSLEDLDAEGFRKVARDVTHISQMQLDDELLARLAQAYASAPVGDPRHAGTLVGPLIDGAAFEEFDAQGGHVRSPESST